ncbi:hypothetical protein E8E13_006644 [Curvularia kusanoi]|uniref:Mitochondrial import inner membrane translocase subunit TIM50 n=1 Tax=Curvularia kusanoi TaxID=90978 RepID=A0A9P4TG71_CURKU|nr:hypothetical protein E8E13_006644 [Curvularia kusanoi]
MSVEFQRYIPHDAAVAEPNTNPLKAAVGHHDSASPLHSHSQPPVAMNNDYNPWAQPFTPNYAYPDQTNDQRRDRNQPQNTMGGYMPPASAANAPQYANHGQPQHFNPNGGQTYNPPAAQQQFLAQAYYYQWAQQYGINQGFTPLNPPQQALGQTPQRNYPFFAPSFAAMQPQSGFQGVSNPNLQYAFDELCKGIKEQNCRTNSRRRASTPLSDEEPIHIVATGPAKLKQKHHTVAPTGRSKERKIMLPPPAPTKAYMAQAAEDPSTIEPSGRILVILDLNGTLLYRPNRNVKTMIARPFLGPFLRYLFANFAVMVWSSARPENVSSLVQQSLEEDLRKSLVAQLARDAFNLKPEHYSANVQVYKNLELVWKRDEIQRQHPDYEKGGRFGQHNTVLIDDSMLKASAQPFNLLLISEFSATPQQLQEDKLRDVAGYLDVLRTQHDVSKFMKREPFRHDLNKWKYAWPAEDMLAQNPAHKAGEVQAPGFTQEPSKKKEKKAKKVKKNRKAKKREAEAKAAQAMGLGVEHAVQSDDSGSEEEKEASDGGIRLA